MASETLTVDISDFTLLDSPEEEEDKEEEAREEEEEEGGEIPESNNREPMPVGRTITYSAEITTAVTLGASAGSMMIAGDPGIFMK